MLFLKNIKAKKDSTNAMIAFLSFSNIIGNGLTIISGLFVAKWLMPEELGRFNSFTLITGYLILIQLGIPSGLSRELPFYLGKKRIKEADDYAATAQYWQKYLAIGVFLISLSVAIYFITQKRYQYAAGIFVIGVTTWEGLYVTKYLKVLFRTNRDFNKLSWIQLINSFIAFASIIFVWLYGFYGLCIRAVLMVIVNFLITYYWRPIKVKAKWKKQNFLDLIKVGLPMFSVASVYGLWPLLQKTIVVYLGGAKALGLFAISIMVENAIKTVASAVDSVIFPTMTIKWGEGLAVDKIIRIAFQPFIYSFLLFSIVTPIGWWLLPLFVKKFIPEYIGGIDAAQWMLVAGLLSLTSVFANIYNVIKMQKIRLIVYISGIIVWACAVFILFRVNGFNLVIFPQAMIAAFIMMAILNFYYIMKLRTLNDTNL